MQNSKQKQKERQKGLSKMDEIKTEGNAQEIKYNVNEKKESNRLNKEGNKRM